QLKYCDADRPYTRMTEHKHFSNWEQHESTGCFKEFSKETEQNDIPYYRKRLERDKQILMKYRKEADLLAKTSCLGRLAPYRYMDMHHVIGEAMDLARDFINAWKLSINPPVFPNSEDKY